MNEVRMFKNITDMTYDRISEMLSEAGIEISRSSLAGKARSKSTKFLTDNELGRLFKLLNDPDNTKYHVVLELFNNVIKYTTRLNNAFYNLDHVDSEDLLLDGEDENTDDFDLDDMEEDEVNLDDENTDDFDLDDLEELPKAKEEITQEGDDFDLEEDEFDDLFSDDDAEEDDFDDDTSKQAWSSEVKSKTPSITTDEFDLGGFDDDEFDSEEARI